VSDAPVNEISARFDDAPRAAGVVEAMNRWFRWIVDGSPEPVPPVFAAFGVDAAEYAVALGEDVDWELGPHARAVGPEVRIAIHTSDTHVVVAGLLRRLGARAVRITRDV
jgi:hypothetical protein